MQKWFCGRGILKVVEVVVTCGNRKAISGGMGTDDPYLYHTAVDLSMSLLHIGCSHISLSHVRENTNENVHTFCFGKTGQSHHFWGCVFCGVVTQLFLVRVLRKCALGLFFATLLLL